MSKVWIVRAGRNAVYVDDFIDNGVVAIGYGELAGPVALDDDRKALVGRIATTYPTWTKPQVANQAGQLFRFLQEIQVGDDVGTYDPNQRRYYLGKVAGPAQWKPGVVEEYPHVRPITWTHRVARDVLSQETRNSLGAIQTVFLLNGKPAAELQAAAVPIDAPDEEVPPAVSPKVADKSARLAEFRAEVVEKSREFIEDMLAALDPYQMQDLVAGILRAMGYKTRVSPKGGDRGVDIFASRDGLGLEEPRVFVEVKHRRNTPTDSAQVRSFLGGRNPGDRCLYVSTGGFRKDARYEAERSTVPLTLVSLPEVRELLLEHYENLDTETRRLVPLTRLYWPATEA